MKDQINKTLYQVAEEILERLAFILSFPEEGMEEIDYKTSVTARVSFSGPFSGNLVMAISSQILPELAGNMLGLDDASETTKDQQIDAFKELMNVVCGNLLPAIGGKESVFNVDTPMVVAESEPYPMEDVKAAGSARLTLEEGQCDLTLFVDGPIPVDAGSA